QLYGPFLRDLGLCNPATDRLSAFGAMLLAPWQGGRHRPPDGLGAVAISSADQTMTATITGSTLAPNAHRYGILLVRNGRPVNMNYGEATQVFGLDPAPVGEPDRLARVTLDIGPVFPQFDTVDAFFMVDTVPAAKATLT